VRAAPTLSVLAWQFRRPGGSWIRVCDAVYSPAQRLCPFGVRAERAA